jgi:hypothetical protein
MCKGRIVVASGARLIPQKNLKFQKQTAKRVCELSSIVYILPEKWRLRNWKCYVRRGGACIRLFVRAAPFMIGFEAVFIAHLVLDIAAIVT